MDIGALALWVVTALGGFTMAGIWLANRSPAQHAEGISRITPRRLSADFALAATGLVLWILYVATDNKAPGWVFALLPIVGAIMFMTWLSGRDAVVERVVPAEHRSPRSSSPPIACSPFSPSSPCSSPSSPEVTA